MNATFKTLIHVKVNIAYPTSDHTKPSALVGHFEQEVAEEDVKEMLISVASFTRDVGLWHTEVLKMPDGVATLGQVRLYYRRTQHDVNKRKRMIKFHMRTLDSYGDDILVWLRLLVQVPNMKFVCQNGSMPLDEALKSEPVRAMKPVRLETALI